MLSRNVLSLSSSGYWGAAVADIGGGCRQVPSNLQILGKSKGGARNFPTGG